jgi:hypothetical protein
MGRFTAIGYLLLGLGALLSVSPAMADSVDTFTFQVIQPLLNPDPSINTLTWQADSSPTVAAPCTSCIPLSFSIVSNLSVNGTPVGPETITFFDAEGLGGFSIFGVMTTFGGIPFSGSLNSPTFTLGTFPMFPSGLRSPEFGTLTVSTPEPSVTTQTAAGLLVWMVFAWLSKGRRVRSSQA